MQKEIKEIKSLLESLPEKLERVIYKNGDDIAVSVARSFERLEERLDAVGISICNRLTDFEDNIGAELEAVRLIVEGDREVVIGEK